MASLEELFSVSDYVSVHTPYSQATRHMIGEKQFNCAKNGSILIATSRGGVVDEDALFKALQSGKIASAGMDVIEDEKNHTSPLFSLPNVIATPHVAYAAEEASQEIRTKILEQLVHTLRDGTVPRYLVNRQVLGHARFEKK